MIVVLAILLSVAGRANTSPISPSRAGGSDRLAAEVDASYRTGFNTTQENPVTANDIGNHCDDCTTLINFPFPITFYGQPYTSGYASSNGNLQFTGNSNSLSDSCLPNPDFGAAILAFQRDLRTNGSGDGIFTYLTGTAPDRRFMILWRAHYFVSSDLAIFSMRFHENDSLIEVFYFASSDDGLSAVTGVQASGTGSSTQFSCHTPWPSNPDPPHVVVRVTYIPTRGLTVAKAGSGSGAVSSSPAGINCGATCSSQFDQDSLVTLTATPDAGSSFAGWSGGGCSGTGTCALTMDAARSVTATFSLKPTLTVDKTGSGEGTVTSSPAGINCGTTCSSQFDQDSLVTLTATPDAGSSFAGWSGGGCSGTGTCALTMDVTKSVTANFALDRTLTVNKTGSGEGTVTSSPAGINCGITCSDLFADGSSVVLTPFPAAGSVFVGWSVDCSGTGTCSLTMEGDRTATATFGEEAAPKCPGFESDPRSQVVGTPDDDVLAGTSSNEVICGLGGDDVVEGNGGDDLLVGAAGRDVLKGQDGDDRMLGGGGEDRLLGGKANDVAKGGRGLDFCRAEVKQSC